jgi:ABC-type multidrug transport system permease subunit
MRFILLGASKDLRRRLADPTALLLWIGLPLLVGVLLGLIGGTGGGPAVKAHLLVVDQDDTLASRLVTGAGGQARLSTFLQLEAVTLEEGHRRIQAGDASALLIIPKGFQDGVLKEQSTELTLITNPAQQILPQILEEGLRMLAEAAFYAQRLFGAPLRAMAAEQEDVTGDDGFPSDEAVAAISRSINQILRRVDAALLPPVMSLEIKTEAERSRTVDFGAIMLPGLLFMSVLFMANGMSLDVWIEKERGTLRRTVSTPQRLGAFLAGKMAAAVVLIAVVAIVALALGVWLFNIEPLRVPLALLWACYAGAALFCFFVLIQVSASSARAAGVASQMVVLPLMMIGGSFFPFEAMPEWMARIGRWTPNGLAVTRVKDILFGRLDPGAIAVAAVAIGVPAALAFALSVRRLRGPFVTS